jgi:hypothetical protein
MILSLPGVVCDFGKCAKHTSFVHIFCFEKFISRTKFQILRFGVCLPEVSIILISEQRQRTNSKQTEPHRVGTRTRMSGNSGAYLVAEVAPAQVRRGPLHGVPAQLRRRRREHAPHRHVKAVDDKHVWRDLAAVKAAPKLDQVLVLLQLRPTR